MGRGRAKAKQAKVARQLKYSAARTDLEALRRELLGAGADASKRADDHDEFEDYADYLDADDDGGEELDDLPDHRSPGPS
ncbi:MAG: DUF3073 family protein [Acidothermus sp.]|nr:DUF3073 family protein [Acidothermus sp.]MCL6537455.1 DUF3073 domain-containing protein [Acidothermus sp.]